MSRMKPLFLDTSEMSVEEMENWGRDLIEYQKSLNWWLGDLARAARAKLGDDNYSQAFPPDASPGAIQRWEAVARAYPTEDSRNSLATWSVHMANVNRTDRIARVQASVDAGRTSDEERKASQEKRVDDNRPRWLLCVDVSYFICRFWFSGAGVEAAVGVATWVQRTVERLKEKGLTDVACCFDSKINNRKELTKDWEDRYKDRPPKDPELAQQLSLVHELLNGKGFACVSIEGYEADDVMASFAKQFDGRVTILSQDKDCRQCLSDKCNMLLDVEWTEDETSGEAIPQYQWLSAKQNTEATGLTPAQWIEFQTIMGDNTDGIKGCIGIGEKGSADLVKLFGSAEGAIAAAKAGDQQIKPAKQKALIEFEPKLAVTRQLVTLVDSLPIPATTRI
ncbi:MAG: 5'-3' exonuclease [Pyrinomonadaceae bacterium]